MTKYFLTFLLLLGLHNVFSQQTTQVETIEELIRKGIEQHDAREFRQAIETYKEALEIDPTSMIATYEMALSYLSMRDYHNASKYSTIVINSKEKNLLCRSLWSKERISCRDRQNRRRNNFVGKCLTRTWQRL